MREITASPRYIEITPNYYRVRMFDPKYFQERTFGVITLSAPKGMKAVVARPLGYTTTRIQSYLFSREKWSPAAIVAWLMGRSLDEE